MQSSPQPLPALLPDYEPEKLNAEMLLNKAAYGACLRRFDLTEDQKRELIHMVWRVMEGFADRAFGLDPVRQVEGPARIDDASGGPLMLEFERVSDCNNPLNDTFRLKAPRRARRKK